MTAASIPQQLASRLSPAAFRRSESTTIAEIDLPRGYPGA